MNQLFFLNNGLVQHWQNLSFKKLLHPSPLPEIIWQQIGPHAATFAQPEDIFMEHIYNKIIPSIFSLLEVCSLNYCSVLYII